MKEFRIAEAQKKLLVVACEPLAEIGAVDPSAFPHASDALAYLMMGGEVIVHDSDDVAAEILLFRGPGELCGAIRAEAKCSTDGRNRPQSHLAQNHS